MFNIQEELCKKIDKKIDTSIELKCNKSVSASDSCGGATDWACSNTCWGHASSTKGGNL